MFGNMSDGETKSAQRTIENSPAIYRWERHGELFSQSATRTTEIAYRFSVARFTGSSVLCLIMYPALKCWAILNRPLRGQFLAAIYRFVCVLLTAHCLLLTAAAQPGMPQPSSPLYGADPGRGQTSTGLPRALKGVGIDQRLNEQAPLEAVFKDEQGRDVSLGQFFKGKPVVLSLVYYTCPMLCTQVLNGQLGAFRQISFDIGKQYEVVSVSFNSQETPQLAAQKKETYIKGYNRAGGGAGWHFLTGDEGNIRKLADAVGFRYAWDEQTKQFAHASGIMVLTPQGKIARYFYGIDYPPRDLRLALVEASEGKIGTPVDALMLYCYHYDPATGKYGAVVMNIMRVAGVITLILMVALLLFLRRFSNRSALKPRGSEI
jgi:protein SCO1